MTQSKPKFRMAPPVAVLSERQEAANRLLALDAWTEEPSNPPAVGVAASVVVKMPPQEAIEDTAPPSAPQIKTKEPSKKPWEAPGAEAAHPYHLVCSERLFQKMDYVWKRKGHKSMREWVLQVLEAEADKEIKRIG